MPRFPTDEWVNQFKEALNKNTTYAEVAKDWEGDFLFIITPDKQWSKETILYIDLTKKQHLFLKDHTQIGKKSLKKNSIQYEDLSEECLPLKATQKSSLIKPKQHKS